MAKINFSNKTYSEQLRILQDYINRRTQHKEQGEVTVKQIVKRFKHYRYNSDRSKYYYFEKLLRALQNKK